MYNLPYYKEQDSAIVLEFMKQHPFAMLIGVDAEQKPVATQVPLLFVEREGQLFLRGHIMKGNDHHQAFSTHKNVLALFTGPHSYVSASWYTNPQQGSTWNYMTVHVRGKIRFGDEEYTRKMVRDLTNKYEGEESN